MNTFFSHMSGYLLRSNPHKVDKIKKIKLNLNFFKLKITFFILLYIFYRFPNFPKKLFPKTQGVLMACCVFSNYCFLKFKNCCVWEINFFGKF